MKGDLLNSLMILVLNGPPRAQFDSIYYATKYAEEHGRCEIWRQSKMKRKLEVEVEDDILEEIEKEIEDPKIKVLIGKSVLF